MNASTKSTPLPPTNLPPWFIATRRVFDGFTVGLNVVGTLLIVAIMVLINVDVIGRGAFNSPVSGVPEILSMSIVAIVFLQVAQTFRAGRLTRTEAILNFIKKRSLRVHALVEVMFSIGAIALITQLFVSSWPFFIRSWERQTFEGTIGDFTAPIWPVKLIILIGCFALIMQILMFGIAATFNLFQNQTVRKP